jgi:hypothetical protein
VDAYTAEKARTKLFSQMVKVTCCSSEAKIVGEMDNLQRHQIFGRRLGLELEAKSLRLRLANHLLGRLEKSIHGSERRIMSGLCCLIIFFKANLVGELARPRAFQAMHFI